MGSSGLVRVRVGVGVLPKATVGFLERQQAMKAQGFLESLWYFLLP